MVPPKDPERPEPPTGGELSVRSSYLASDIVLFLHEHSASLNMLDVLELQKGVAALDELVGTLQRLHFKLNPEQVQ